MTRHPDCRYRHPLRENQPTTALPVSEPMPCAGLLNLFYAPLGERPDARAVREAQAKRVCARCPALISCRAEAREHCEFGVWGGETEEERAVAGYPVGRCRINHSPFG